MPVLRLIYRWWMKFAHALGVVNSWIILSALFITAIGIYNLLSRFLRLFTASPTQKSSYWLSKDYAPPTEETLTRQF